MTYRFMRMLCFFDLPTYTAEDRRNYRLFRRMLVDNGFIMMQESVYCKLLINATLEKSVADTVRKNRPPAGVVQLLTVTEKQFASMEYIVGEYHTEVVDTDERMVIL